ncbi:unnamed protein product [Cercopithifilaria johnstoni]|uniref:Uncharacterized protein n=1 Tax=Cercopithifilaria johnstoni TaxID=2874296 RepID=A0A8J2PVS1_9BILA|nr:unnamed protein product [Cercopithifilaria johnstoni]
MFTANKCGYYRLEERNGNYRQWVAHNFNHWQDCVAADGRIGETGAERTVHVVNPWGSNVSADPYKVMGNATSSVACAAAADATAAIITTTTTTKKKGRFGWQMWCSGGGAHRSMQERHDEVQVPRSVVSAEGAGGSVDDCERVPISSETTHKMLKCCPSIR